MIRLLFLAAPFCLLLTSCGSFMHGYTQKKSFNYYQLINNNPKSLANKRLQYNLHYHRKTELACFLNTRPKPDFILEYEDNEKKDAIHLYYLQTDSVFIFKECNPKKPLCVTLQEARTITSREKLVYETLAKGNAKIKRDI
jgi:hypothetical protein